MSWKHLIVKTYWAAAKNSVPGPFWAKSGYIPQSRQRRTLRALPLIQSALYLFWPDYAQVHPSSSTLIVNCSLSFYSQSEALHSSTLCPPYERRCTGDPLHLPRHTSSTRICLRTSAETHRYDILGTDINLHHGHRRLCVRCIRNRGRLDLPYVSGVSRGCSEAGYILCNMLLVWRGVGCGGWRGSLRTWAFVHS